MKFPTLKNPYLRRMTTILLLSLILTGVYFAVSRSQRVVHCRSIFFTSMSTWVTAQLYDTQEDRFHDAFSCIQNAMREIESSFNVFNPESELARLNETAAEKPFACSDRLWTVLCKAREIHALSDGAFDITIGPLMKIWDYRKARTEPPTPEEIRTALEKVGLEKVRFDDRNHTVFFTVKGMSLDLGGIAKGYALDFAAAQLRERLGMERGFLNLGGNALALRIPPPPRQTPGRQQGIPFRDLFRSWGGSKTPYSAGIRNPFREDPGAICGIVTLSDEAVSTSGNYERYQVIRGKRYSHIIDPRTGYPVENMLSVTVITKHGMDADALSTAIFVSGSALAEKLKEKYPDLRVLIFRTKPGDPSKVESFVLGGGFDYSLPEVPPKALPEQGMLPETSIVPAERKENHEKN